MEFIKNSESRKSFTEINFYPLDIMEMPQISLPTTPNLDSSFRIKQINTYNNFLQEEIKTRENIIEKFKYFDWGCFIIEMILVMFEIISCILSLIYPMFLSLSSSAELSIMITTISTFLRGMTSKFIRRVHKHQSLLTLAKGKYNSVKSDYEIALLDEKITHEEYIKIVDQFKKYETLRSEIISSK
ncbi:hypothetical protein [Dasineura jujubifolia toursvirus 2a]|nr:hypothetical protein [Dasineura jujubifolia toursvirus 2a]